MFALPHRQHHFNNISYTPETIPHSSPIDQVFFDLSTALSKSNICNDPNGRDTLSNQPQRILRPALPRLQEIRHSEAQENDMGEHMLRRKTPNGTLSAGYDGSLEWPFSKRVAGVPNTQRYLQDVQSPGLPQSGFDQIRRSRGSIDIGAEAPSQIWLSGDAKPASMDSMLYQPAQNLPSYHNPIYQVPHVVQPGFWSPNYPLTVSNAQPRFGPYWPDGSFEPFRPATYRVPRQSQWPSIAPNHAAQLSYQAQFNQRPDHWETSPIHSLPPPYDPRASFSRHISDPNPFNHPQDLNRASDMQTYPSQSTIPAAPQWSPPARSSFTPQSDISNSQFKSRVLHWAHGTHSNLMEMRRQAAPKTSKHGLPRPMRKPVSQMRDTIPQQRDTTGHVRQGLRSFSDRLHGKPAELNNGQIRSMPIDFQSGQQTVVQTPQSPVATPLHNAIREAQHALRILDGLCSSSNWTWIDGTLLGGCLAYGLEQFEHALQWYERVLLIEPENVEALSNTAAAFSALGRKREAEQYWHRAIKLRPHHWEAVEHLVGLLCQDQRPREAVSLIESVEHALRIPQHVGPPEHAFNDQPLCDANAGMRRLSLNTVQSGYKIPSTENGRLVALIHAKGNMLYALGDNLGASRSFEEAILLVCGKRHDGIAGLIGHILEVFAQYIISQRADGNTQLAPFETILLAPQIALETKRFVFPVSGQLPGLRDVPGHLQSTAILYASNSLLSLAKIYQDGMSSGGAGAQVGGATPSVQDILALYYLSLSLQPSPSTANNVGILLASVQQTVPQKYLPQMAQQGKPNVPGVVHGSGIALALSYYNYGLSLDDKHAHLYTNLGSLLKDIGQLNAAIKMYENAVGCDGNFDIALANLANAVKDQGRISDAINYYRRAVKSSPDFPEAVCGLANALNSVCSWKGRGGVVFTTKKHDRWHVDDVGELVDAREDKVSTTGWIGRVVAIVEKQLRDGKAWGKGITRRADFAQTVMQYASASNLHGDKDTQQEILDAVSAWSSQDWEGAKVTRLVERATRRLGWQMYQERHVLKVASPKTYPRPQLTTALTVPGAPTVLPFHTFTCPLTASQIRKISQRNGLRISCSALKAPWLPNVIFEPPSPPGPYLKVGYVSSDFNNHPLAHLMQSVFGFHDPSRVKAICYATTPSDNSIHREQIQRESPVFYDASSWSVDRLVKQIVADGIHILVNLNGYTRGARNEVFAARPAPVQMSFMGFAGTLGAEWCDYLLADDIAVPPSMLRPWRNNVTLLDQVKDENYSEDDSEWVYGENIIFAKETFFCCDHRQSAPDAQEKQLTWKEEKERRRRMRKELFPDLDDDTIILGNFNQLYKIEPTTFRTWLRILEALPKAILWLLRFPDLGEQNLKETAEQWSSPSVAARIIFTDVAPKNQHIARARICDLFLDTPECNAHTTAADVLWSGTPLLTLPRYEYKMCSRMAASILRGALPRGKEGDKAAVDLIATSDEDYEEKAIKLATGLASVLSDKRNSCRLLDLRRMLYEGRWTSALFDTRRWVRDLEDAYEEAWRKWVAGEGGDIWLKDIIDAKTRR